MKLRKLDSGRKKVAKFRVYECIFALQKIKNKINILRKLCLPFSSAVNSTGELSLNAHLVPTVLAVHPTPSSVL